MKKISIVAVVALFAMPGMVQAADQSSADDQAFVAASYQQGDAADPAAPVTDKSTAAPVVEDKDSTAPLSAKSADEVAAKPEEALSPLVKIIDDLNNKINALSSQVNQLQRQTDHAQQQAMKLQFLVYGLAGLVILLALLSLVRRNKKPTQTRAVPVTAAAASGSAKTIKVEDDTQSEYDFMGSSEGIPAKLDLARAYIAMEDFTAARETLAEILGEGSDEHRLEAKALLNKIKP